MKNQIATSRLLSRLLKTASIKSFISTYDQKIQNEPFYKYLEALCKEKGLIPSAVIKKANIERTYGLQIFRGIKNPSRDKVIQLAFGFLMNVDETQQMLKQAEKSVLYSKIKRDAVIIYSIKNKFSVIDTQELLSDLKLPLLGGEKV